MKLRGRDGLIPAKITDADLVFIGIYTSKICNHACIYCFESAGKKAKSETTLEDRMRVLDEAKELGAKSMFIAGAGEPILDPVFVPLIKYAYRCGLTTLLYTNGTLIDEKMAEFLFENDVTPIVKLESMDEKVHNELTGKDWAYRKTMKGIVNLLKAGYCKIENGFTRIGVAALYTKLNMNGLQDLKEWCQSEGILLMVDCLTIKGRALKNEFKIKPDKNEILKYKEILGLDEESAGNVILEGCIFWRYGIVIDNRGYARPCTEVETKELGNIKEHNLKELNQRKTQLFPIRLGCFTCFFKDKYYL